MCNLIATHSHQGTAAYAKADIVATRMQEVAVQDVCSQEDKAAQQEELAVRVAPRATGETVQFGMHFPTLQSADAFCRSYHSPLCQVPGMSNNVRVLTCCALNSAMPRRNFKSENKRGRDAD